MRLASGHLWRGVGYGLTAAWMIGILVVTGSDPAHPWFDYIFVVPLAGWIVAVGVVRLVVQRKGSERPIDPDPPPRRPREP